MKPLRELTKRGRAARYRSALVQALMACDLPAPSVRFLSMESKPVFRVDTARGRFAAKFHDPTRSAGLPAPAHVTLCTWVPGRALRNAMSDRSCRRLGECAARLHQASGSFRPAPGLRILTNDRVFYRDAEALLSRTDHRHLPPRRRRRFRKGAELAGEAIRRAWRTGAPIVIHNDLHPCNIKVHGGRLFLYDFEDVTWGFPVQDIISS